MSDADQPSPPVAPQWTPNQRELDDLDVVVNRSLGGAEGFVDPTEPATAGAPPFTLVVPEATATAGLAAGAVDLIDPEGAPLARLTLTSTWDAGEGRQGLVGAVERSAHNEFGPFRRLYRSPDQVHADAPRAGLLAVPVRGPMASVEIEAVRDRAADEGLAPLLIALVGEGTPVGSSGVGLLRMTLAAADELTDVDATVAAVALADHGPGHRDRLIADVAAAYADHAHTVVGDAAEGFPAAVASIVERERPPRDRQGAVIFFTGLSGSGKSTLARALVDHVLEAGQRTITSLDGDVVRHHLSKGLGFSREDRETNILRIGFVAAEIARHGGLAICSPIAPFDSTRRAVREMVERAGGGFVLIHVATPLEECERRDRKGLYARARRGEIPDFTGISSPYEEPDHYFAKLDTTNRDIAECLRELVEALVAGGWLSA